jgi:hypothetical protein
LNTIPPLVGTNNIRYADFIRLTTPDETFLLSSAPSSITVPEVDEQPFAGLGQIVRVGDATRDIKSTANETIFTLVGIDTAMLGLVLSKNIKGSQIEAWKGFFGTDGVLMTTGGTGGLYQFFNGYVTSFGITEEWMEEARSYVGLIALAASSIQMILQNRTAGRYTNNNAWQFFAPGDTSMNRVSFITTINYQFGKDATANS